MWTKVVIFTATLLVFSQAWQDWQKGQNDTERIQEFVDIDNATYFIDTRIGYQRDEAKAMCESMNMTMISFEGDEQKLLSITRWLVDNGYDYYYFWIDALKDEGSTEWYWETSTNIILENDMHWAIGNPSMPNATIRTCISFCVGIGGYDDDACYNLEMVLPALCQY